ncbi:hypothetical protein NMG60_11017047 [Bertholletia excelsa]
MVMAAILAQPPIPPPGPLSSNLTKMIMTRVQSKKSSSFGDYPSPSPSGFFRYNIRRASEKSSGITRSQEEEEEEESATQIKSQLYHALQGTNRGIFGVPSARKSEIEGLVKLLESNNPTPAPALFLDKVDGCWRLVYSTITILGSKRTKLGLRDFISLGDFSQFIDVAQGKAVNVIKFNVRGLNLFNGQLKIEASFTTASESRVDIKYENSTVTPNQLMNMFRKNYDLLLSIFNPEGWLEITYVDETLRIGRDDKGNIFILERYEADN